MPSNPPSRPPPRIAEYQAALAETQMQAGDMQAALDSWRRAVRLKPDAAALHYGHGAALARAGQTEAALQAFRRALSRDPAYAPAHAAIGATLLAAGRTLDAEKTYRTYIRLHPGDPQAHFGLGCALQAQGAFDPAAASFTATLAIDSRHLGAQANLGLVLREAGQLAAAVAACRRAVAMAPESADTLSNLGTVLRDFGALDEAEATLLAALARAPAHAEAHFGLAMTRLLGGRLAEGWADFGWRPGAAAGRARYPGQVWRGEPAASLLIYAEQGAGDFIQFARFVAQAAARVQQVMLCVPESLRRLAASLHGVHVVLGPAQSVPLTDYVCADMDLAGVLGADLETIPAHAAYLAADPAAVARWRARLEIFPGRQVGIAWAGNPTYRDDRQRSIPAELLAALGGVSGVTFVSLQPRGAGVPAGLALVDWTDELQDFAETAALIAALDLTISVDTAVAHLAGALGRPVWLLNRFSPDWRWMLGRDDSPWYPQLRQFRQSAPGDWAGVLARVRAALQAGF